jgi:tetratricopeptide (TPR) repeat protein
MLRAIEQGRGDSLRAQLAALAEARPRDPSVLYLLGVAQQDGDKALPYFQAVVENHPGSEWADDALLRLYHYYYAVGAYNTADSYASRLRSEYPRSPLATDPGARRENRGGGADTLRYAAQVGVFASLESARELLERMQRLGYTAELALKQVGERSVHAVWVGRFATLAEAKAFVGRLRQRHRVDAIPVRR